MDRPTVHDLARHARVSLATVDRVLNGRPGVRDKTVARVKQAINELGYTRDVNAATLARKTPHRFVFLLPRAETQFMDSLITSIRETAGSHTSLRANIDIVQASMLLPQDASAALQALDTDMIDGLAIMAPETPTVRDAVIKLRASGVEVVPIISDLPGAECGHFVGINNVSAGRTAGGLMGRFCAERPGKIAVIVGNSGSRDGIDRRFGFDDVISEHFSHLTVLPTAEGRDRADRVEDIARLILRQHDDLSGIYLASAGTSGLHAALKKHHWSDSQRRPRIIAHELTPISRRALEERLFDAVISQDVGHIARSAVRVLRARKDGAPITDGQERIRIDIFTRENLPETNNK